MGLSQHREGAGQVLPLTPITDFELEPSSNSASPNSTQSASPNTLNGLLTLPTVLQETDYTEKQHQHQPERRSTAASLGSGDEPFDVIETARSMGLFYPYARNRLFLPVFPKPFFNLGLNGTQWLSENPLRQRGLRFRPEEDPQSFVTCQLCGNSILGNREINLQNHARRHSTLKQFQCCYCHYVHSEITKVRLHMAHNHNDNCSRPINNVNSEMRESWRVLMNDCFPGHPFVNEQLQRRYTQRASAAAIQYQRVKSGIDYSQSRYCPF